MSWVALAAGAGTAIVGGVTALASSQNKKGNASNGLPSYNGNFTPIQNRTFNPQYGVDSLNQMMPGLQQAAAAQTAFQTQQREGIMPGAGNQFLLASNALQSGLQGQVPQDVIDATNRAVAQRTGGGFNLFTGGGQAPANFARNIGQTSYGIQQNALQQAPAWQQLANSFVIGIPQVFQQANATNQLQYQYDALNTGIDQYNQEGPLGVAAQQYQAGVNQYQANQLGAGQQQQGYQNALNMGLGGLNAAASIYGAYQNRAGAYNGLPAMRPTEYRMPGESDFSPSTPYINPASGRLNLGYAY